ncbi:hypothetical protein ABC502_14640 [Alkalimonas sp. NCh-2]|uniref:hypothetical protein n=1 Tax=Alkalimonas sp. NCh-2 TaxID=3144846 RepID=UPI0031F611D4
MLRFFLISITALYSSTLLAHQQYTVAQCEAIAEERERIKSRFRTGYRAHERDSLNRRDNYLFQQLSRHCTNPIQPGTGQASSNTQHQRTVTRSRTTVSNQPINTNYSARNRVYTGEKAQAWQDFYQASDECRRRNPSQADFVACAEDRTRQRREFEALWSQNNPY